MELKYNNKDYKNDPVECYNQVATEYLQNFKLLDNLNKEQLETLYSNVMNRLEEEQQEKKLNIFPKQ